MAMFNKMFQCFGLTENHVDILEIFRNMCERENVLDNIGKQLLDIAVIGIDFNADKNLIMSFLEETTIPVNDNKNRECAQKCMTINLTMFV